AGAEGMDDLRHHLLAAAALALDQHGEVGGGHLRGDLDRPVEQGRRTDDAESLFDGLHVHAVVPVSWMGSTTWPCRLPLVELVMRAWTMSPGRSSRAGSPTHRGTITTAFWLFRPNMCASLRLLTPSISTSCTWPT